MKFTRSGVAYPPRLITLLILFGIIVSNIFVNVTWNNSVYGQNVQSAFPQFPMIPSSSSSNTSNTNVTSSKKALQEPVQPPLQPSSSSSLPSANTTSKASTSQIPSSSSTSVLHGVRITVPIKGQQVLPGAVLKISGTSKDNASSDCHVNVIVNHVRPYQNASAGGPGGPNDYSNWTFSLASNYTLIKLGTNEITAKFSCNPNPSLASFYSVNVTGVLPSAKKVEQVRKA